MGGGDSRTNFDDVVKREISFFPPLARDKLPLRVSS